MKHADFVLKQLIINLDIKTDDNKMYCAVCIMFGIANKNYVKRPDSNSYLGQQSSRYVTGPYPRLVGGGENMFPYFR